MDAINCRYCRGEVGKVVLDLGLQPACEYFPQLDDPAPDPVFPLRLWLCADCGLAQLADDADLPDQPEGIEPAALREQRRAAVAAVQAAGLLSPGATVVEGSTPHGGSWLPELTEVGLRAATSGELADMVVDGSFGLMHATDQAEALDRMVAALAPDGVLLFQFHTLAAIVRERQWNAVRLGHYAYYSAPVVARMLAARGLTPTRAWTFPLYGGPESDGTVLVAARRGGVADASVDQVVAAELAAGVLDPAVLEGMQDAVAASAAGLRQLLDDALLRGARVLGYSAASRAVAMLHLAGITAKQLPAVADASPAKHGCRMPGTDVAVVPAAELVAAEPDLVLLFVADLLSEVRKALPEIEANGGRWVTTEAALAQETTPWSP